MKKIKIALIGLTIFALGSCTVSHTAIVTNNPVGSKIGIAKAKTTDKDADFSFKAAMKNGGITKVGIAEAKVKVFIFPTATMVVTGE
tara:strand:- start:176 stop:436 length:261 start_codon:yes stop_codon:yes gene_type:complete